MNPDRFTIKTQEALQAAQRLAEDRHNPQLVPEHLLAVLLEQESGVVVPVLDKLGADAGSLRAALNAALDSLPRPTLVTCRAGPRSSALVYLYAGLKAGEPVVVDSITQPS